MLQRARPSPSRWRGSRDNETRSEGLPGGRGCVAEAYIQPKLYPYVCTCNNILLVRQSASAHFFFPRLTAGAGFERRLSFWSGRRFGFGAGRIALAGELNTECAAVWRRCRVGVCDTFEQDNESTHTRSGWCCASTVGLKVLMH